MKKGCLYWITGLSGAGKTTIGTALYYKLKESHDNVILLDGDILKNIFESDNIQYTENARRNRAMKYAKLCKSLADQGMIVVCCTIAMYHDVRKWNREYNDNYVEIFLDVPMSILVQRDKKGLYSGYREGDKFLIAGVDVAVEFPQNPDLTIKNDGNLSVNKCIEQILAIQIHSKYEKVDNVNYWNRYYQAKGAPEGASQFAKFVMDNYVQQDRRLLELGCGNGRDSLFFRENHVQVVGIDSSENVINSLRDSYPDGDILFVCDDFTRSNTLYQQQYDYCYSRFTLHAINLQQEDYVVKNVYQALKKGNGIGFFFIEVRSVNDDIYGKGEQVEDDAYIYEGHYRRFIRINDLQKRLESNGFKIIYAEESNGFAPYKDRNPMVIRIVAQKK